MARLQVNDCVAMTSTTTGTGALTLATALTGFQTFDNMLGSDGDYVYYTIIGVDGSGARTGEWETGWGVLGSSGTTLTRANPLDGSNGTYSNVDLSAGTKQVYLSLTAEAVRTKSARVYRTTNLTGQDFSASLTDVTWQAEQFGEGSWAGGSPTLLTIPVPGGPRCLVWGQLSLANVTVGATLTMSIRSNDLGASIGRVVTTAPATSFTQQVWGYPTTTIDTTSFKLQIQCSDISIDI